MREIGLGPISRIFVFFPRFKEYFGHTQLLDVAWRQSPSNTKEKHPQDHQEQKGVPYSGRVRPQQGTEICNFGAPSRLDFFEFSPVDVILFFQVSCRKSLQNVARFVGREKRAESCHVSGCHGLLFGPDLETLKPRKSQRQETLMQKCLSGSRPL